MTFKKKIIKTLFNTRSNKIDLTSDVEGFSTNFLTNYQFLLHLYFRIYSIVDLFNLSN